MNRLRVIINLFLVLALFVAPLQGTFAALQPMHDDAVVALQDEQRIAHPACAGLDLQAKPGLDCPSCVACATLTSSYFAILPLADGLIASSESFLNPHDPTRELRPPENLLV